MYLNACLCSACTLKCSRCLSVCFARPPHLTSCFWLLHLHSCMWLSLKRAYNFWGRYQEDWKVSCFTGTLRNTPQLCYTPFYCSNKNIVLLFFFLILHNIYVPISLYKPTLNNHKTFQTAEKRMPLLLLNLMYKMGQITFVNKSDVQRAVQNICYHNIRIAGFFHKPSFRRYNCDLLFIFKHSN